MRFRPTALDGVIVVETERVEDERGHFVRHYSSREFSANGIRATFVLGATSYNRAAGTLRGLHFQAEPFSEAKLVSCSAGRAFDVVADLRPGSRSFGHWVGIEISAENALQVFVPEGFAHGFQTLAPDTTIEYRISAEFRPELARGVRWDDPTLAIAWPYPQPACISARDRALPWLTECKALSASFAA